MRPLLWICAGVLAFLIQGAMENIPEASGEPVDPLSRFVGSAQEAFGDTLFLKADVYFHGGVTEESHHDETAEDIAREGTIEEPGAAPKKSSSQDWIARINDQVQPHEVRHLTQGNRKEMLPFFALSAQLDPRNVEAVLTTAFWLDREFDRSADAIELLAKGTRDNPNSWEIENALGRLYLRQDKNALAEQHLKSAIEKAAGAPLEKFQRVDLYYHLAQACLAQGKKDPALASYRDAVRYFDERTAPYMQESIRNKEKELSASG